jgi:uncharacterized protein YbbK (DUF523 family)
MTGCVHGIRGPVCPECPNGVMVPTSAMAITTETLTSIRHRAEQDQVLFNPKDVLAILDRIAELEAALLEIAGGMARDDARDCAAAALRSST